MRSDTGRASMRSIVIERLARSKAMPSRSPCGTRHKRIALAAHGELEVGDRAAAVRERKLRRGFGPCGVEIARKIELTALHVEVDRVRVVRIQRSQAELGQREMATCRALREIEVAGGAIVGARLRVELQLDGAWVAGRRDLLRDDLEVGERDAKRRGRALVRNADRATCHVEVRDRVRPRRGACAWGRRRSCAARGPASGAKQPPEFEDAVGAAPQVDVGRLDRDALQRDGASERVELAQRHVDRAGADERRTVAASDGQPVDARAVPERIAVRGSPFH